MATPARYDNNERSKLEAERARDLVAPTPSLMDKGKRIKDKLREE